MDPLLILINDDNETEVCPGFDEVSLWIVCVLSVPTGLSSLHGESVKTFSD